MSETTYPEQAGALQRAARVAACEKAGLNLNAARAAAQSSIEEQIKCINFMRAAGDAVSQAAGRQLTFTLEVKEFVRKEILPLLPDGTDMATVQACVHVASKVTKPIETREELASAKKELQLSFESLGVAEAPCRKELQQSHDYNPFSEFVRKAAQLTSIFGDLVKEHPMEDWPKSKLDEFLDYARPVKEKIELAEKLAAEA